jgi:succinate dehydrogenase/fumarate reductase-like Fe-S protein
LKTNPYHFSKVTIPDFEHLHSSQPILVDKEDDEEEDKENKRTKGRRRIRYRFNGNIGESGGCKACHVAFGVQDFFGPHQFYTIYR